MLERTSWIKLVRQCQDIDIFGGSEVFQELPGQNVQQDLHHSQGLHKYIESSTHGEMCLIGALFSPTTLHLCSSLRSHQPYADVTERQLHGA